jgi:queuine tRNA-ribosyltransferase
MKNKPLIFGIIQGGINKCLRKYCADELVKIGFDGFAFGGWPVDAKGIFLDDIVEYTASLMPDTKIKYAMGVGMPQDIKKCVAYGYNLFDCVLPTRDARHGRLYVKTKAGYKFISATSSRYKNSTQSADLTCSCDLCKNYSLGYLYNLFKHKDSFAGYLATIHNLTFYNEYMRGLK